MAFKRDLIIASIDPSTGKKKLQQISEEDWKKAPAVEGDLALELQKMVDAGGVLAAVPEDSSGGIGAACYLINIGSIKVE